MSYGHARVKNYLINKVNISNINCKVMQTKKNKISMKSNLKN